MASDVVQVKYEQLEVIAKQFRRQAEQCAETQRRLKRSVQALQNGGWLGQGATAFFNEMNVLVFPAMQRLQIALTTGEAVTREIIMLMRQAEEEAAQPFRGDAFDEGGTGTGQPTGGGTAGGSAPPAGQPPVARNPSEIFNPGYMQDMIGSTFQGANSPELNRLMEELHQADGRNPAQVNSILDRMADLRGVDRATFRDQYQTFLELRERAKQIGQMEPSIDLARHGDFLGSTVALRYGQVVGDALGIDPVFGSLLNPTGGLVGPGDNSYLPADNDAVGYHGIVHDAAGYLYNGHNIGPGYDYLNRDILPTSSPLSGQVGGIAWWMTQPGLQVDILPNIMPDIPFVPRFVEQGIGEVIEGPFVGGFRSISAIFAGGSEIADGLSDVFSGDLRDGAGGVLRGGGTIVTGIGRSILDRFD